MALAEGTVGALVNVVTVASVPDGARRLETVVSRLSRAPARALVSPCAVSADWTLARVRTAVPVVASTGTPNATDPAAGTAQVPVRLPLAYTVPARTLDGSAWPKLLSAV